MEGKRSRRKRDWEPGMPSRVPFTASALNDLSCVSHESLLDRSTLNWATKIAQTNPASISTENKNVE